MHISVSVLLMRSPYLSNRIVTSLYTCCNYGIRCSSTGHQTELLIIYACFFPEPSVNYYFPIICGMLHQLDAFSSTCPILDVCIHITCPIDLTSYRSRLLTNTSKSQLEFRTVASPSPFLFALSMFENIGAHCPAMYLWRNNMCYVISLYRQNAIAIQDEVGDSNGGNV